MKAPHKPSQSNVVEAYEQLSEFNRHCRGALELFDAFGSQQIIPRTEYRYYRALLEELRALVSQSATEFLSQHETSASAAVGRRRLRLEKQMLK